MYGAQLGVGKEQGRREGSSGIKCKSNFHAKGKFRKGALI